MGLFYVVLFVSGVALLVPLALLAIMMLIDLFTIPSQIKKKEERLRNDLLVQLVSNQL
jgi:cytochrome c-type biogenesis protein CcmE